MSTMTNEQINTEIASACGWVGLRPYQATQERRCVIGYAPDNPFPHDKGQTEIHDYVNDLNAMHQAEHVLNINQLSAYADELDKICVPTHICPLTHWQAVVMATARQRAEAFIRVIKPL